MSNPTSPKKTAEGAKVTATLSTSTSSFEALDPHDPQLNHLASLMFSKSAEWMQVWYNQGGAIRQKNRRQFRYLGKKS